MKCNDYDDLAFRHTRYSTLVLAINLLTETGGRIRDANIYENKIKTKFVIMFGKIIFKPLRKRRFNLMI